MLAALVGAVALIVAAGIAVALAARERRAARRRPAQVVPRRAVRGARAATRAARLAARGEREHALAQPRAVDRPHRRRLRARASTCCARRSSTRARRIGLAARAGDGATRRRVDGGDGPGDTHAGDSLLVTARLFDVASGRQLHQAQRSTAPRGRSAPAVRRAHARPARPRRRAAGRRRCPRSPRPPPGRSRRTAPTSRERAR